MQKKIEELNKQLIENGSKDVSLNPSELSVLKGLRKELESTSTMNASAVADGVDLAVKLSTQWPYGNRLPGLDLLRLLAVAPKTAAYTHPRGGNIINIIVTSVNESKPPTENNIMMAIRFFVNLFESAEGRMLAISEFDSIQAFTTAPINAGTTNRNLLVAATTLYINFAVLLTSESSISTAFENALAMLEVLSKILSTQTDSEVVYRAMVATGTLLGIDDEVRSAAKDVYGMEKSVGIALAKAADPRVKSVAAEIRTLLNTRQLD
jgi:phospholipase A-2-activating protein